jgi:hypothetical protein
MRQHRGSKLGCAFGCTANTVPAILEMVAE